MSDDSKESVVPSGGFQRIGFSIEFDVMKEHCSFIDKILRDELVKFEQSVKSQLEIVGEGYEGDYKDFQVDQHWHLTEEFPRLQWHSQFVTTYALFEKQLNNLCEIVGQRKDSELELKDIYGQGIARARTYLVKVGGVKQPFDNINWQHAKFFADIRNAIIHKGGEIEYQPNNKKSLSHKIEQFDGVSLKSDFDEQKTRTIEFDKRFVVNSISVYTKIISSICNHSI